MAQLRAEDIHMGALPDVKTLEDLVLLLTNGDKSESPEDKAYRGELQEWLSELNTHAWKTDRIQTQHPKVSTRTLLVPQLFLLIQESLLAHRWQEVAKILITLIQNPQPIASEVYPVGAELFVNAQADGKDDLMQHFINQAKVLRGVNSQEVVLQYALYLLIMGKTGEARNQIESVTRKDLRIAARKTQTDHSRHVKFMFNCYRGLINYVEFSNIRFKLDQTVVDDSVETQVDEINGYNETLKRLADKAIRAWSCLPETPGIWDIFIPKLVELLEFQGDEDKCEERLKTYAEKNPDNPNAIRYLYEFYKKQTKNPDKRKIIDTLQKFCDAVPSDQLSLELFQFQIDRVKVRPSKVLYLIFDLLDYIFWQNKEDPWVKLANCLYNIMTSNEAEDLEEVDKCWQLRATWWPKFHFRPSQVETENQSVECLVHKAVVAALLLNYNIFTGNVLALNLKESQAMWIKDAVEVKMMQVKEKHVQQEF